MRAGREAHDRDLFRVDGAAVRVRAQEGNGRPRFQKRQRVAGFARNRVPNAAASRRVGQHKALVPARQEFECNGFRLAVGDDVIASAREDQQRRITRFGVELGRGCAQISGQRGTASETSKFRKKIGQ